MNVIKSQFNEVEFVEEPVKKWQKVGGNNLLESFYIDPKRWGFSFEFYSMFTKIEALLNSSKSEKLL